MLREKRGSSSWEWHWSWLVSLGKVGNNVLGSLLEESAPAAALGTGVSWRDNACLWPSRFFRSVLTSPRCSWVEVSCARMCWSWGCTWQAPA